MSFDEEQQRRSRVVIETPTARREIVQQRVTRTPEKRGVSTGVLVTVALSAVALTALLFLFLSNRGDATNRNINLTTEATPVALAPTPLPMPTPLPTMDNTLPPFGSSLPPMTTQPGPVIIEIPNTPDPLAASPTPTPTPDDGALQSQISNRIISDRELAAAKVSVNVTNGVATITGTAPSADARRRASKLAAVRGVRTVDNQLTVATPAPTIAPPTATPAPAPPAPPSER